MLDAPPRALRPRDSATLLLLDRREGDVHVLMGRRHASLSFMADKYVFPGGRSERSDALVATQDTLVPAEIARPGVVHRPDRLRTLALAAIRETAEEAGILVARPGAVRSSSPAWAPFVERGLSPALADLRLVARAETPPGGPRRFDSRFFALWHRPEFVAIEGGASGELEDIRWPSLSEALGMDIPDITRTILEDLSGRLAFDPGLEPGGPAFFYRLRRGVWERHTL